MEIEVQLDKFDGAVCGELANHGEHCDETSRGDEDAIIVPTGDEPRELIELRGKSVDDWEQLNDLEVVR